MKLATAFLFACLLPSLASALTREDCSNQLAQCIERTCVQAGCQLSGTDCSCTPAEEAQWDALTDAQCQDPFIACTQQASEGSGNGGGCCGAFILLLAAGSGILLARRF